MFEQITNDPERAKKMQGQPWYVRYAHVLAILLYAVLFGLICWSLS